MQLELRPARESDYQAIVELCKSSIAEVYAPLMGYEAVRKWAEGDATDKHIRRMLPSCHVALAANRIAGVVILEDDMVDLLWVAPDMRSHGVGAALLDLAEKLLSQEGHHSLRLECFEKNTRAVAFYERQGWQTSDRYFDQASGIFKLMMTKKAA